MNSIKTIEKFFLLFLFFKFIFGGAIKNNNNNKENKENNLSPTAIKAVRLDNVYDDHSPTHKKNSPKKMEKKCQCGRTEMAKMTPLMLTNIGDDKPIKLWCEKDHALGKGTYSKVFHAEAELKKIGGKIVKKCVALKMTLKDVQNSDWQKHIKEWRIQNAFDRLKVPTRVIRLFAYGFHRIGKKDFVFSVLELGRTDLIRHMKIRRYEWIRNKIHQPDDSVIEPDFRQLVETVRDMHQKIMHLDLKPSNLVFVRDGKHLLMKAIDFGASQFIDEHERDGEDAATQPQANACKWFASNDPLTTEWYQSPEHFNQCNWEYKSDEEHSMELSSKSDIWAIGIIGIEMAAIGTEFKWMYDEDPLKDSREIVKKVYEVIGELWRIYIQDKNDLSERMDKDWEEFYQIFFTFLSIRSHFPRLFHIITAVLVYEPERRPTANGILNFLDGKCRFESMQKPSRLLPWLTIDQFKSYLVRHKFKLFREEFKELDGDVKREMKKQIEELDKLIELANADEWVPGEKQRKKPCDTVRNKTNANDEQQGRTSAMGAQNAAQQQSVEWKKRLTEIEKTIGLSLSSRIQSKYEKITEKYKGLIENLQDSFYNSNFEIVYSMEKTFVGLLWTLGYGRLLGQLDTVSERYQRDAKMLNKIVDSIREQLGAEWEEIYEIAAQYECDEEDKTYVDIIDQISALYLYEMMYKQLLDQFISRSELKASLNESSRAKFLFKWLRLVLNNLKKFHAEKEKGILKTLQIQQEQFEKRKAEIQKEKEEIQQKRRTDYIKEFEELREIERTVQKEMKQIRSDMEQVKTKMSSRNSPQQRPKKTKKDNDGGEAVSIFLNQNFDLLLAKKKSEEILAELRGKMELLDEEFENETMQIQFDYENSLVKIQEGQTLRNLVERKVREFDKTIF